MDDTPIPIEDLARARRKMCRRIAAALIGVMAETDTGFDLIAARIGLSEASLRRHMKMLIDGQCCRTSFEFMAYMAFAMGCEIEFRVVKKEPPINDPASEPDTLAAVLDA